MVFVILQEYISKIVENPGLIYNIWKNLPITETEKNFYASFFYTNDDAIKYWKDYNLDPPLIEFSKKIREMKIDISTDHHRQACFKQSNIQFEKNENNGYVKKMTFGDVMKVKSSSSLK